jgi:glycosyltransferase involved in cell wall biosynthesis
MSHAPGVVPQADSLRVLMLNHNVVWRSTFYRAFYFARELADLGHRVTIATISGSRRMSPRQYELEGVRIVETPDWGVGLARTGWDPWDTLWRCRRFSRETFDVVHGFDCRPVVLAPSLLLARRRGLPWVSDWADCWGGDGGAVSQRKSWVGRVAFRPLETWLEEGFRHRARAITVTSRTLLQRALGLGLPAAAVHYVPSGANVRTVTVKDRTECRRRLGIAPDGPVACFVGWVQYDLDLAIGAFREARARVPDARLLLVGPKNREAAALVDHLGLSEAVIDFGPRPFQEIPTFLGAADVLLLPMSDNLMNRARGPIKLGDYLAAGRAIVANPVGDLVEVFRNDDVGLLAGESPEEYGAAVAELLADGERCARMGREARRVAEEKYAWGLLAPSLVDVYHKALAG